MGKIQYATLDETFIGARKMRNNYWCYPIIHFSSQLFDIKSFTFIYSSEMEENSARS